MINVLENAKRLYNLKINQTLPVYKRYLFDDLFHSTAKLTAIYGSRGIGKTTILMQLLQKSSLPNSSKLYISCDHAMFQDVSLFDFVDEFSKRGGELICIDEVHEAKNFEQELKSIYDFLDIKVYFTGSSALHLTSPDFARRYSMHHLYPLSLKEYLELTFDMSLKSYSLEEILANHENIASEIIMALPNKKILKFFDEFLKVGAYPFYFEDKTKYVDRIIETINTILHTDLSKLFSIPPDKIDTLKKLLLTICVFKPLELGIDKLAFTVGITKTTLYKYIEYLDDAELIKHIRHEGKRFAAIRKPDKLYLANTNLFEALCAHQDVGTLRETYFVSCLAPKHTLHYLDKGDFLVDEKYTVEIGGKNKSFEQIKDLPNSYVIADGIEVGFGNKIPLWLAGFIY
ncbi:AAA family ATPase [Sulfurovum sp.]|uniref:ATP-binding protein n=1 Tax=Sulfurovum sp. TaxID=1969726 RepID=UPI002868103D|nr:AAA family ATPase [Sulfurovum sp.]